MYYSSGLEIPTQDDMWCDWCGEASDTDICASCQRRYEEETATEAEPGDEVPTAKETTMDIATAPIVGVQTAHELAQWLITAEEQASFATLPPRRQLFRLADRAHAKRQYRVRDACAMAARVWDEGTTA